MASSPESSHELLVSSDDKDCGQEFLWHLHRLATEYGPEGVRKLTSLHGDFWMYEQRPHPVHPSRLHRENGAVRLHLRHLAHIGGSSSEKPPARTTERDAKNVGA